MKKSENNKISEWCSAIASLSVLVFIFTVVGWRTAENRDAKINVKASMSQTLTNTEAISQGDLVLYDYHVNGSETSGEYIVVSNIDIGNKIITGLHTSGETRIVELSRVTSIYTPTELPSCEFTYTATEFLKKLAANIKE